MVEIQGERVQSLSTPSGESLDSLALEPAEIGRIEGTEGASRKPVSLAAISPLLQKAVLASEDARFYVHRGIDLYAIGRALFANIQERRFAQGGSTITQQLAKNLFLSPKKTLVRKLREAELALLIEWRYSKEEILAGYLNRIYFGQDGPRGLYGVEAAADAYFSKSAKDLTLEESALLAGIIRSPNRYPLLRDPQMAIPRRNEILARMHQLGMIGETSFHRAVEAPVRIRPRRDPACSERGYFADYVKRFAAQSLGEETFSSHGCRYYTTLDPVHQASAREAVAVGLAEIEKVACPAGEPLQAALVAVDPATGEMTALIGGRGYRTSPFNRATSARRQPGSAFKPFVLLAALAQPGQNSDPFTLSQRISGASIAVPSPDGVWTPANFEKRAYQKVTIRQMIEESVNTAAVRLAIAVGLPEVVRTAQAAGITSPLDAVPSLALGSFEVTPLELAYAYASIASGGVRFPPLPSGTYTGLTGASGALRIWARFIHALYPHAAPLPMTPPPGVVTALIDPASGYLATASCPQKVSEAYLIETLPQRPCPLHSESSVVTAIREGVSGLVGFFLTLFD